MAQRVEQYKTIIPVIFLGAYPESPSNHKKPLWERLSAAKLNDRG
jgi:hypothetical protein